ncbi:MAG: thioesterase [Clostridiales bacterium]|nr:thioesterase [Clostridiales bacterium]
MYSFDSRVRYSEVGPDQRLSITGMINYFQDCSTFQSEDIGLGISYMAARNRAWYLSSWQIVPFHFPALGERILVGTWPYEFRGIYAYRNFTIQSPEGEYLVKANSIWFFFDTVTGRPVKPEPEDLEGYEAGREERLEMDYAPRRITLPAEYMEGSPVTVMGHHIDTNHHVNNAQYVEIAREVLPEDVRIRELRVEYKRAAMLGDVMVPHISRQDGICTVALCDSEGLPYAVVWLRTD